MQDDRNVTQEGSPSSEQPVQSVFHLDCHRSTFFLNISFHLKLNREAFLTLILLLFFVCANLFERGHGEMNR